MEIRILSQPISISELAAMAEPHFIDLVKAVVDVEKRIMAIGGELHADEEALLLERGSALQNLWGINLYPGKAPDDFIEFDSMINLRPSQGNRSRGVDNPDIRNKVIDVVRELVR